MFNNNKVKILTCPTEKLKKILMTSFSAFKSKIKIKFSNDIFCMGKMSV